MERYPVGDEFTRIGVNSRVGDIKKEKFVVEMYKQKSPRRSSKKEIQVRNKSVCPVTGGNHVWRFGKCRNCGVGEGYVRYSPAIPKPKKMTTSAMSRRGRQMYFDGTAETRKALMFTRKNENYDSGAPPMHIRLRREQSRRGVNRN